MYLSNIVIDTHLNWTLSAMLRVFYILIFILLVRKGDDEGWKGLHSTLKIRCVYTNYTNIMVCPYWYLLPFIYYRQMKKDFVCIDDLSEKRYCGWIIDTFDIVVVLMHYLNPCTTYQVLHIYNERERDLIMCVLNEL